MPFYVSAGLTFINFLYGLFVLPESLPNQKEGSSPGKEQIQSAHSINSENMRSYLA